MSKNKKKKTRKPQNDTTFKGKSRYALKVKSNKQMYGIQRHKSIKKTAE